MPWVCPFTIVEWNPPFNGVGDEADADLVLCDGRQLVWGQGN